MLQSFAVTAHPQDAPPRVARLRAWLEASDLDAVLVPRADMHGGEYVAPRDERLAWITGFTGSAGFAVIARDRAAVFTDGRYALQVTAQTDAETFETVDWPVTTLAAWLAEHYPDGLRLSYDPMLHTMREAAALRRAGVDPLPRGCGVDAIWEDRPAPPMEPATAYPEHLAGTGAAAKRALVAEAVRDAGAASAVLAQPDSLCWLLNVRGTDVPRNPVVHAWAAIDAEGTVTLLSEPSKFDALDLDARVRPWSDLDAVLRALPGPVLLDPAATPEAVAATLREAGTPIVEARDPAALPRARKTEAELAATREAHLRDGAAVCRFLRWLDEADPRATTEIDAVRALEGFRRDTNALLDVSFETIAGAGAHGAVIHYRVTEESDRTLLHDEPGTLMVVDSGGQYLDGTTDVTRTVPVGDPPPEAARDFTRVLQGMIAVSRARFPRGVAGCHLDALARLPLWAAHKDYDHGTGHGVGVYLSVHEGPVRISRASDIPLEPGMILSNEPGYYRAGHYGIRIENLVAVRDVEPPEGGDAHRAMRGFETLTWAPIDRRLIVAAMLSPDERDWIDAYHAEVRSRLEPRLDGADRAWLRRMTEPL